MNIIIIGGNGFVGRNIQEILSAAPDINMVTSVSRENEFNLLEEKQNSEHERILRQADYIINCAAFTKVNNCEIKKNKAIKINSIGPKNLSLAAKYLDIPIIHFSSDYVFNGYLKRPYNEKDIPDPINFYGFSKACSELLSRYFEQHLSIVGPEFDEGLLGKRQIVNQDQRFIPLAFGFDSLEHFIMVGDHVGCY